MTKKGITLAGYTIDDFRLYKMDGTELALNEKLSKYQPANKKPNKRMIVNFRFDMRNVIILRLFGTDNYIYIK